MENEKKIINNANDNTASFKAISNYQKVENDKERIKSKFNFSISRTSSISSANKLSSLATQQNSCLISDKIHKIKNKIKIQNFKILTNNNRPYSCKREKSTIKRIKMKIKKMNDTNITLNQNKSSIYSKNNNISEINDTKSNRNNKINNTNQIDDDIINNITYNNYEYYYSDNSSLKLDEKKNDMEDSVVNTQVIDGGINNYISNNDILDANINEKILDIKLKNEKEEGALKPNENKSFNNTSFSGSSKTAEINRDLLNIRNEDNDLNEDNIKIVNNNNYIIRNFNGISSKLSDNYKIENNNNNNKEKPKHVNSQIAFLQELFQPYYINIKERKRTEISASLLEENDYNIENKKMMLNNASKYYFIEDIIKKNNSYVSLSFDKFKNLSNKAKYKIFTYIFDNYRNILNTSKAMRNIIKDMLEEKFGNSMKDFSNKYENILQIENYQFNVHKFNKQKKSKKTYTNFCLYLKAKVLPDNEYLKKFGDIGFEISYKYKIKSIKNENNSKSNRTNASHQSYISKDHIQEEYTQIYKFDLRENKNYPMWLCSERDEIFNKASKVGESANSFLSKIFAVNELYQKHLIYSSPIINVNENDYIVLRIDLIEDNNVIEDLSFNDVIVQSVNKNYFHKDSYKSDQKFDNMRDCENEIAINLWHEESAINDYYDNLEIILNNNININYEEFIQKLKNNFQNYFDIKELKFDFSKFIFLRMTMEAKKIGVLKKSAFSNKSIEIVDKNESVTKECVPINFVNTFSMNKHLVIKKGTLVDLYLIE